MKYSLNFKYKGSRTYLHGTDIFNEANKLLREEHSLETINYFDMLIPKIVKNNLDIEIYKNKKVKKNIDAAVSITFKYHKDSYVCLLKQTNRIVESRNEYPEHDIIKKSKLNTDDKTIRLTNDSGFSNIENIVAMNKALLQAIYPTFKGKWLFTRLQLRSYNHSTKFRNIKLIFLNNFNFKLTKSQIICDTKEIGFVYFSSIYEIKNADI